MNLTIRLLLEQFPPDQGAETRMPDFSVFNLTVEPPHDLIELLSLYGRGTFSCTSGDPIRIFPPDANAAEFLRYTLESWSQVMATMGDDYDVEEMTLPKSFFENPSQVTPKNLIYWGQSDNGVMLCSLHMNEQLGWTTVLIDDGFQRTACYFKSPAAIIFDSFMSHFLSAIFPESSGPYRFESER